MKVPKPTISVHGDPNFVNKSVHIEKKKTDYLHQNIAIIFSR